MTYRRIAVSLVTFILTLGLSPSLVQADGHTAREKKEKIEKVKDAEPGDAKDKAKEGAKDAAKEEASDAAREAAGVGKKPKRK